MSRDRIISLTAAIITIILFLLGTEGYIQRRVANEKKNETNTKPKLDICRGFMPCGWSVYSPFTKKTEYFMPNTCNCREGFDCVMDDDDFSISAFVHVCKRKTI